MGGLILGDILQYMVSASLSYILFIGPKEIRRVYNNIMVCHSCMFAVWGVLCIDRLHVWALGITIWKILCHSRGNFTLLLPH